MTMACGDPRNSEREIVAHHEAGHAVAALALGVPVECVTIIPHDGRSGGIWHHKTRSENEILIAMAGPMAEALFTRRPLLCGGDDEANIGLAMRDLPEPRAHYEAKAAALVKTNWKSIKAVVSELTFGVGKLFREQLDIIYLLSARP